MTNEAGLSSKTLEQCAKEMVGVTQLHDRAYFLMFLLFHTFLLKCQCCTSSGKSGIFF